MEYPGSTIEYTGRSGREFLDGIFTGTTGLVMQQVTEISGLATPAVQNWVSRGFIAHPVNRRYDKNALARILIINSVRGALSLPNIKKLLTYVNGSPESRLDDIIPESELYSYVCDVIFSDDFKSSSTEKLIDDVLADYNELLPGAKARLKTALTVIIEIILAEEALSAATETIESLPNSNVLGETFEDQTDAADNE